MAARCKCDLQQYHLEDHYCCVDDARLATRAESPISLARNKVRMSPETGLSRLILSGNKNRSMAEHHFFLASKTAADTSPSANTAVLNLNGIEARIATSLVILSSVLYGEVALVHSWSKGEITEARMVALLVISS